jgi:dihydrofolate synthase/folylpolyglutamate synthase
MYESTDHGTLHGELGGIVQIKNATTVLTAVRILQANGVKIPTQAVRDGFEQVVELTGLMGRWQTLQSSPKVVCDTGHNVGGWQYLKSHLEEESKKHRTLFMVVGMVNDKDINSVLALMPKQAYYFFTQAAIQRAMPAEDFASLASQHGLQGEVCSSVPTAIEKALAQAEETDMIFIGGSTFIVADALPMFINKS